VRVCEAVGSRAVRILVLICPAETGISTAARVARARSRGSIDSGLRDNSTLNACFAACSWTQRPVEPRQVSLDAPKAKYVFDAGAVQRALADGRSCVSRVSLQGAGV
jgi:hypothetical protein